MAVTQWDSGLAVGIALIDEQHKEWLGHLGAIANAIESGQGPDQIAKTLSFLSDYTDFHFATEEKHMAANNYPGLDAHRRKHAELRDTLKELVRDFLEDGATHPLAQAVNTFLGNWLQSHIREVDTEFAGFLKAQGIDLPA
jgi:hemerythrin-like metal-binding protein